MNPVPSVGADRGALKRGRTDNVHGRRDSGLANAPGEREAPIPCLDSEVFDMTTIGAAPAGQASQLQLTEGGPGVALLRRLRLSSPRWHLRRVAVIAAAVTWLPLLGLSALQGLAGPEEGSFLRDLATHARMLVALPVLVLVERAIGVSLGAAVEQFGAAELVRAEDRGRFTGLIADSMRLRDSRVAEVLVLLAVCLATFGLFSAGVVHDAAAWLMPDPDGGRTLAGYWYGLVSLPIFHLVWLRWLYLIGVWAWFLGRVSRLDLRLDAAHPDATGGLGFLGECIVPFGMLLFAASAVFAAEGLRRVLFMGVGVGAHWPGAVMLLVVALVIFVGPLLGFVPALIKLRHHGALEYGALASRYTHCFAQKWLGGGPREDLLGNADIQALADLASTHERVEKMRVVPLGRRCVVALVIPGLIPLLVLAAAVVPLSEILSSLMRIFV